MKAIRTRIPAFGTRPIRTNYFATPTSRKPIMTTHARWAATAVPNAIARMQFDEYSAMRCEVFDEVTGQLHAQINRAMSGDIRIAFMRNVVDDRKAAKGGEK